MANKTFLGSVHRNQPEQFEALAGATLTPGMLTEVNSSDELIPHGTAAGAVGFVYVAKELTANFAAGGGINEDYTTGETAQAYIPTSGEMYQMLVATGQTVAKDDPLESAGNGLLQSVTTGDTVCYADEAVTTSATTPVRVKFQ